MGKTVAVYQRPDAPIVLTIMDLPLNESVRDFQWLSLFSNFVMRLSQLACSKLELPKYTPRILSLSVTQVIFAGPEGRPAEVPIHKPSVFRVFSLDPEPCSKMLIIVKALLME